MASQDVTLLDFVLGLGASIPEASTCSALITHHAIQKVDMHRMQQYYGENLVPRDKQYSVNMLRRLIELGVDFNETWDQGYPLGHTIEQGWVDGSQFLVQNGARVESLGLFYAPPLHIAARLGYFKTMELLLRYGADPNSIHFGYTPLMLVDTKESASLLLKYGASLTTQGSSNLTAVHMGIIDGKVELLSTLLTLSEAVSIVRKKGNRICAFLSYAAKN